MHKFIGAACRRTAGMAAGVMLTGGLVGGVLLAPGTAYAAVTPTATQMSVTQQASGLGGTTLDVTVSVTPTGATGPVTVSGAGSGCHTFVGMSGTASCDIPGVAAGTYTLTAAYQGSADFSSSSTSQPVTVAGAPTPTPPTPTPPTPTPPTPTPPTPSGNAPVWSADSPPTSVNGQSYNYQFLANGSPSFELVGAPSWLGIGPDGMVSGTIPAGITSFSYSVEAWNNYGHVFAGPFNVFFRNNFFRHEYVNLRTYLWCTSPVFTGQHGTCTLWVANDGRGFAPDVTAQIVLPWQLRPGYGGYYYGYSISGNTVSENLGTLYPGETKELSVPFTARSGFNLWGRHPGHRFTVQVVGSASSGFGSYLGTFSWDYNFWGQRQSYSVAYVTIIPRGYWW